LSGGFGVVVGSSAGGGALDGLLSAGAYDGAMLGSLLAGALDGAWSCAKA